MFLNPVTRKRLARFREIRSAWWALGLLVALYAVSLGAELICNDRPLYLRMDGKSYFPAFRYYPDDLFTAGGLNTRPDYKAIAQSPRFAGHPDNFMIFAPVPYGPNEILKESSIAVPSRVTVRVKPVPRVAALRITPDLKIEQPLNAGYFFGIDDAAVDGRMLADGWTVSPALRDALQARFDNRAAPAFRETIVSAAGIRAVFSAPEYTPRAEPPTAVRLRISEAEAAGGVESLMFDSGAVMPFAPSGFWDALPPPDQSRILALAQQRLTTPVPDLALDMAPPAPSSVEGLAHSPPHPLPPSSFSLSFNKEDVRWPFRPAANHWLGVDESGRDVFARILYGMRISMSFGLLLVAASMLIGVAAGAVQGYFGGWVDLTGQRLIEIWSALPFLYVMILIGSVYGRGFLILLFCYALFNWIGISYYVRAEVLKLRRLPFVEAARVQGVGDARILFRHILPNGLVPVITFFPFSLVGAIGALTALDYLGFGLPPPTPSWGEMLGMAQRIRWAWWLILYPSLALFIVMMLGVLVGEGVRAAFDPRRYGRLEG